MILPDCIQQRLASRFGHELRYPGDFEALSLDIAEHVGGTGLSVNTLKRLFGLIGPEVQPRRSTLDALARYLGASDWMQFTNTLSAAGNSAFGENGGVLDPATLPPGTHIRLRYAPDRSLNLEVQQGGFLCVLASEHSKLQPGDVLHTRMLCLHYPLVADNVWRDRRELGRFTAGQTGGLTELTLL